VGESWLEVLLRGSQADGQFGAFVFHHAAIPENPPHAHQDFAKVLYILDGHYEFRVGNAAFSGGPGCLVLVPKGSQHAFTTATGGRVLFVCTPSGNEEMFLEIGVLGPEPSPDQLALVNTRFHTTGLPGPDGAPWRPRQ
jgi:quercetin dioxygenase-like cupin family protein